MSLEESPNQQHIYRQTGRTRHKRGYKHRYSPARTAFDCPRGHNCGNITPETHNQWDKRFAMQADTVHQPVHYECRPCHIARILHK